MKNVRKFVCVFLSFLLMLSIVTVFVSADTQETTEEITTGENVSHETTAQEETTNAQETTSGQETTAAEETDEEQTQPQGECVVRMTVCCRVVFFGHVWLYFENLTDSELSVGCYPLPAGKGVSVGTMMLSRADGGGVYYNIEAYCGNKLGLSGTKSRSIEITAEQLKTVNEVIMDHNSWSLSNNCGYFAAMVWNSVAPQDNQITRKFLPLSMKGQLKGGIPSMPCPEKTQVFKQKGTGTSATLKQCSPLSLVMYVG